MPTKAKARGVRKRERGIFGEFNRISLIFVTYLPHAIQECMPDPRSGYGLFSTPGIGEAAPKMPVSEDFMEWVRYIDPMGTERYNSVRDR